jgi:hypothetical protein
VKKGYKFPLVRCMWCQKWVAQNWAKRHWRHKCRIGARKEKPDV